ncbi:hypothetical protein D3C77_773940 [compost metagenome]
MAVAPAQHRFGIGMQAVIQAILGSEKMRGQGRYLTRMIAARLHQAPYIASGAKRLGPRAT